MSMDTTSVVRLCTSLFPEKTFPIKTMLMKVAGKSRKVCIFSRNFREGVNASALRKVVLKSQ